MGGTVILPSAQYIDVRYPDGRLAFRFDPIRAIIEIQHKDGTKHHFDLTLWFPPIENSKEVCYNAPN